MLPQVISFKLCPFVQRIIILLNTQQRPFELVHIDISQPPDWFQALSPLGRVPVLKMGDKILFESLAILEYLNECPDHAVNPAPLHDPDPIIKAQHRAWMSYGSELLSALYGLCTAANLAAYEQQLKSWQTQLVKLAAVVQGDYFNGQNWQLVDIAFAPLWVRVHCLEQAYSVALLPETAPALARWRNHLCQLPVVKASLAPDFIQHYLAWIKHQGGYLSSLECKPVSIVSI